MGSWANHILKFLCAIPLVCLLLRSAEAEEDDDDDFFFMPPPARTLTIPPSAAPAPQRVPSRTVCVRTCDGYFFPLPVSVGRNYAVEMCQALCPVAGTKVYFMSTSGTINQAVSLEGQPYSSLPNAGVYIKSHDPHCACRLPGESWRKALEPAEALLGPPVSTDIFVTAENGKRVALLVSGQKEAHKKTSSEDSDDVSEESTKDILTAGSQSSGVGPKIMSEQNIQRLPSSSQSVKASMPPRPIAPHIIPVPVRSN